MRFPIQTIIDVHSKKLARFGFRNTLIVNFDIDCFILRFSLREYYILGLFKFDDNLLTLSHCGNSASSSDSISLKQKDLSRLQIILTKMGAHIYQVIYINKKQ